MSSPNPRVIVPNTSKRDTLIAVGVGALVLAVVILGIVLMNQQSRQVAGNKLTGTVVAKNDAAQVEKEITYGRKGLSARETESRYSLDIRVEQENRTYTVPVGKDLFDARQVGDRQSFIRPPSEQK